MALRVLILQLNVVVFLRPDRHRANVNIPVIERAVNCAKPGCHRHVLSWSRISLVLANEWRIGKLDPKTACISIYKSVILYILTFSLSSRSTFVAAKEFALWILQDTRTLEVFPLSLDWLLLKIFPSAIQLVNHTIPPSGHGEKRTLLI